MKTLPIFLLLLCTLPALAQQPDLTARPGSTGIFLDFGKELPKTFRYQLERRPAGAGNWTIIAEPFFPRNADEFGGRLANAIAQLPPSDVDQPAPPMVKARYQRLVNARTIDSLVFLAVLPHYKIAAGVGFWDTNVQPNTNYDYRLTRIGTSSTTTAPPSAMAPAVRFPGRLPDMTLEPDTIWANGPAVTVRYVLRSGPAPDMLFLYRAYYLRGEFKPVPGVARPTAFTRNREPRLTITDASATDKMQYSYYAVPGDYLGNRGKPTATRNIYNARQNQIIFLIDSFRVDSYHQQNALRLSWRVVPSPEITSVDIYRGNTFDGRFDRIASVRARDSVYFDATVEPVKTYFYSIVVNTAYGRAFPSARVPALMQANKPNESRPAGVLAQQTGRVVTFRFARPAPDVYGYYLYRGRNYRDKPEQVGPIFLSKDSLVTLTDSVPTLEAPYWTYSIASVNTSYNISPLSDWITVQGMARPLPPDDLTARLAPTLAGGKPSVQLVWTDSRAQGRLLTGYQVFRRTVARNGQPARDWQPLSPQPLPAEQNMFTDLTAEPGQQYSYAVCAVGTDPTMLSARSLEAGAILPDDLPAGVLNLRALQSGKAVVLQWNPPFDPSVARLVVYRAEEGQVAQRLKELPRDATQFTDPAPVAKKTVYYKVVSEDSRKRTNRNPGTVGLYVE